MKCNNASIPEEIAQDLLEDIQSLRRAVDEKDWSSVCKTIEYLEDTILRSAHTAQE